MFEGRFKSGVAVKLLIVIKIVEVNDYIILLGSVHASNYERR